jgi:hypothetical protein
MGQFCKEFKVIYDGGAYSSTGPIAASIPYYVYEGGLSLSKCEI